MQHMLLQSHNTSYAVAFIQKQRVITAQCIWLEINESGYFKMKYNVHTQLSRPRCHTRSSSYDNKCLMKAGQTMTLAPF